MLEKDRPQDDDLDYDYKRDGASVGYPTKLVQVDEQKSVIVIDPSDEKLQDKTYLFSKLGFSRPTKSLSPAT